MGCDCSSNENETDRDMDPNTFGQSKIRVRGSPSDELDFESETEGTSAVVTHTNREKQQARRGFKDAVLEGNESRYSSLTSYSLCSALLSTMNGLFSFSNTV